MVDKSISAIEGMEKGIIVIEVIWKKIDLDLGFLHEIEKDYCGNLSFFE